ncbi:MAG: hypothetical protein WCS17_12560 [Prevotella sp.]
MITKNITCELYDKVYTEDTPTARSIYNQLEREGFKIILTDTSFWYEKRVPAKACRKYIERWIKEKYGVEYFYKDAII